MSTDPTTPKFTRITADTVIPYPCWKYDFAHKMWYKFDAPTDYEPQRLTHFAPDAPTPPRERPENDYSQHPLATDPLYATRVAPSPTVQQAALSAAEDIYPRPQSEWSDGEKRAHKASVDRIAAIITRHFAHLTASSAEDGERLDWSTGTPDVKEGGCETFWCAVEGVNGKTFHRHLDYANRHQMPLADHIDEAPAGVEPVPGSDEDFYWTGWHEKSCDQCETQWMLNQRVIAWMRLPKFNAARASTSKGAV